MVGESADGSCIVVGGSISGSSESWKSSINDFGAVVVSAMEEGLVLL